MKFIITLLCFFSITCHAQLMVGEVGVIEPHSAASAYVFKASVTATAAAPYATVTTGNADMTGVTDLWVATSDYLGSSTNSPAPTDNQTSPSNTYTLAKTVAQGGSPRINLWYCHSPHVSSTMTFTFPTTAASFPGIIAAGFSGGAASPLDQTNSAGWGSLSGTVVKQPGSVTPTQNGELVIVAANLFVAASAPTIDGGFSTPLFQQSNSGQTYSMMMSWLIQGTAAAANPNITFVPAGSNACGLNVSAK